MPRTILPSRRETLATFLSAFAAVALVREARGSPAVGDARVRAWIDGQHDIAQALATGRITGVEWTREVERLAREVDVDELMAVVRRSRIGEPSRGSHNDPQKRHVRFLGEDGMPRRLSYGAALFDFAPENVVTPHGHRHMVSAHLVVAGRLRVRNFDRIGDREGGMLIRPSRDYVAGAGQVSTMCGERDNIHWFVPVGGGSATTFDIVISGLDAGAPDHLIEAIDPVGAGTAEGGALLAPIIGFEEAAARYTASV